MSEQQPSTATAATEMATPVTIPPLPDKPINWRKWGTIGAMVAWGGFWVGMALFTLQITPASAGSGRGLITADSRSIYLYWLVSIPIITGFSLAMLAALFYHSPVMIWRVVWVHLVALVVWFVLHLLMVSQFNNRGIIALASGFITLCWLAIALMQPTWPVELKPGHIYYHKRASLGHDSFEFVARRLPKIDQHVMVQLAEAGLSPDALRLYLNWGAPPFLRDKLSAALLQLYYARLVALHRDHPRYFAEPKFKADAHDVNFTQENIRYMLAQYHQRAQQEVERLAGKIAALNTQSAPSPASRSASTTPSPQLLALQQQQAEAQQAQQKIAALQQAYVQDTRLLVRLFEIATDPRRVPEPLHWIAALDIWRVLWNKTQAIPVKVKLDRVYTRDSMVFRLEVSCFCTFEPDMVDDPKDRLSLRDKGSEDELRKHVITTVTHYITQAARQFFQVMPTTEALRTGPDTFRRQLAQSYNTEKAKKRITMLEGTVDCQLIVDERIVTARIGEIEDEREIVRLKKLLELGEMPIPMQAETVMRLLILANMPSGLHQFPAEALNTRSERPPGTPPAMSPPAAPEPRVLPSGEDVTVLPLDFISEPGVREDTQGRRAPRTTDLDGEILDTQEDDDDPDVFHPRRR